MPEKLTPEEIESIAQKMAEIILQRTSNPTQVEAIEPNAIYTTPDAARVLKVRPSTIQTNVRRGLLIGKGRPFRILGSELLKFQQATTSKMKTTTNQTGGFTLVEIMIVVVIIGLLAAMAIPAFQKVRQSSQDKAVMNNARQLSAAADQYFLENGVSSVTQGSLVGSTNYVKALNLVANETYPGGFTQGITITIAGVAGQRTITYSP